MQPHQKPLESVSDLQAIAQAVGAKEPTAEAIILKIRRIQYGVRQLGLVVTDIKKALTGLNGNANKINDLVAGVTDFIESDFN